MTRKVSAGSGGGATFAGLQGFTTRITSAQDLDITIEPAGQGRFLIANNAEVRSRNNLRFSDNSNSHWVGLRAAASVPDDVLWTLPSADGTNNQVLTTDGAGTLAWTPKTINIANNTTDSASNFIIFANSSSGDIALTRVSSTGLTFQPSTGTLSITRGSISNSLGVGTAPSGTAGEIRATDNVIAYFSDDRLKTRLGIIENALDKVDQLTGFYYEPNETAQNLGYKIKRNVGVSAQDVEKVLPEIIESAPIDDNYMTVMYDKLTPLLIQAIKELRVEVNSLKESINGK